MNTLLWILQIVLAIVFAGAGLVMLVKTRVDLSKMFGDWVDKVPAPLLKLLGLAELAAAVGLVLPPLVGVFPLLTALAAAGLVIVMIGAIVIHAGRSEYQNVALNLTFAAMAGVIAFARLGPYAF